MRLNWMYGALLAIACPQASSVASMTGAGLGGPGKTCARVEPPPGPALRRRLVRQAVPRVFSRPWRCLGRILPRYGGGINRV